MSDNVDLGAMDDKEFLRYFLAEMQKAGATGMIRVDFDGYGDSGDVHAPELSDDQKAALEKTKFAFKYGLMRIDPETKTMIYAGDGMATLLGRVRDVINYDWINGEGGFGHVELDIDNQKIRVFCSLRETITNDYEDEI